MKTYSVYAKTPFFLMMRLLLNLLIALLGLAQADAQEIKILGKGGDLWSINPTTAEMQYLGWTGLQPYLWDGMAVDSQDRMFAAYGRFDVGYDIYEVDPNTAQASFVVHTNLYGIRALAFGPGDVLFLVNERDAPLINSPSDLHTLNLTTGANALIGDIGALQVYGLDFFEGELFGFGSQIGLAKIDTQTALATDVNPSFSGPPTLTISFCFSESGALFYIDTFLWMMDSQTGVVSLVNPTSPPGLWAEAEFIEGPTDPFALWVGGVTDGPMSVKLSGASANANVAVAWSKGTGAAGPTAIPAGFPCAGTLIDLKGNMQLLTILHTNAAGEASTPPQFVPAGARRTVRMQAVDLASCKTSNRILISY